MGKSEAIRDILEGYGKGNWFSVNDGSVSLTWWENDGHEYVYIEAGHIRQLAEVVGEMEPINYGENGSAWTTEVPRYCPNCGREVFQP